MSSFFPYFDTESLKVMLGVIVRGFLTFFLPYFAGKYFIKNEIEMKKLFYVLGVAAGIVFLMGLSEYATNQSFFQDSSLMLDPEDEWRNSQISYERSGQVRVSASFSQPLYLGTFFGIVALINILLLFEGKRIQSKWAKIFNILQIFVASFGILLTQSRTVIVAILISTALFLFLNRRKMRLAILAQIIISMVIVVILISVFFSDYLSDFIRYNIVSEDASANWLYRVEKTFYSINYVLANFNWFGEAIPKYDSLRWFYESFDLLNGFINQFLRNGIFFFLLYIYLWIFALRYCAKRRKNSVWSSVFFFVLIYLFVVNNITAINMQNEILFYIFLGLSMNHSLENIERA